MTIFRVLVFFKFLSRQSTFYAAPCLNEHCGYETFKTDYVYGVFLLSEQSPIGLQKALSPDAYTEYLL